MMLGGIAAVKLLNSLRSKMNGQTREEFGLGHRSPLTPPMVKSIKRHMLTLKNSDLGAYSFERRRSDYAQSKSDLVIYDGEGKAVLHGRETDGPLTFWQY